jgi:hypothetical protein
MATRMQQRRGTAEQWISTNSGQGPVLNPGEIGYESDTNKFKIGDGVNHWVDLSYFLDIDALGASLDDYVPLTSLAQPLGVATLDGSGKVLASQIPNIDELAQDAVDQALTAGTGITKTYDDEANTITIAVDSTIATKSYADNAASTAVSAVIDSAPAALDTLNELAAALGDDANYAATITNALAEKAPLASPTFTGTIDVSGGQITGVANPEGDSDAVNKGWLISAANNGINAHNDQMTNVHGISNSQNLVYTNDQRLSNERIPSDSSVSTQKIVNESVTAEKLASLSVVSEKIDDSAVTTSKINDSAITADKIVIGAVTTEKIDFAAVTEDKINNDAVTTDKIADLNITEAKINNAAVTEDKIGTGAVTEGKIADSAVTSGKIAASTIVDSNISASAAISQSKVDGLVTDLGLKAPIDAPTFTGTVVLPSTTSIGSVSATEIETLNGITASTAELNHTAGLTSGVQGQLDDKAPTDSPTFTTKVNVDTNNFNVGSGAEGLRTDDNYTNPIAVFSTAALDYAQVVVKNTTDSPNSSSDLILYSSNGDDASGWVGIGITAPSFSDPDFTITGGNDGYIFMEAPAGTTGDGNLVIATGSNGTNNHIVFAAGGLQSNNTQMTIFPDENVHIEIDTPSVSSTTGALTVVGGVGIQGDINIEGNLDVDGQVDLSGVEVLPIGPGAKTFADTLTNPTVVAVTSHNDYAQIAHQNTNDGANASTDIIMYPNNGADDAGYVNMGITSSGFNDPDFTITGPNDGYIFMVAPESTTGNGDLVLATGDTGARNAIVFAAGGLASDNEQMTIIPDVAVHIEIPTPSTSPTTGALTVVGGVGIQGDLNIEGSVNIEGTIVFGGAGTTVETSNLSVTDPLIFVGDGNTSDIVDLGLVGEYTVGSDIKYAGIVRDASDGVVKAFKDASTKPTSSVNFAEAGLAYADLQVAGITASSLTVGDVSNTEIGYLDGVTSNIQTQINDKAPKANPVFTDSLTISNGQDNEFTVIDGVVNSIAGFTINNGQETVFTTNSSGSLTANGITAKNSFVLDNGQQNVFSVNSSGVVSGVSFVGDGSQITGVAALSGATFTGPVTVASSGIAFTDKTQTKAGVPSLTTIATPVSSSLTLDALGTDAAVRDSLIPLDGQVTVNFDTTGNAKYSIGSSINFYQSSGTGAKIAGAGITILATPGTTLRTTYSSVTATKVASTTWLLAGDLKL